MSMTGLHTPKRVQWMAHGKVMRVDSVPFDTDVHEYAKRIRDIEKHNWDYVVLDED